jgi:putative hydrolase of the HAD superfamily
VTALRHDRVRGILLDFYGTIAEAPGLELETVVQVMVDSLARNGIEVEPDEFLHVYRLTLQHYLGVMRKGRETRNAQWVADTLTRMGHPVSEEDERVQAAVDGYFDHYAGQIVFYPDALEVLPALGRRWPLGLVSNFTDPRPVRRTLERDGLTDRFRAVVVSAELGFRKPHPLIFETALAQMGLEAGEVLFVGDDPVEDVDGARDMGMLTARVDRGSNTPLSTFLSLEEAAPPGEADLVVKDLRELADALLGGGTGS